MVIALIAVGAAVAVQMGHGGRQLSKKLVCLSNLKHVATSFKIHGSELDGYPFATSSDAIRALIEGGIVNPEHTRSPRTSEELVIQFPSGTPVPVDNRTVIAYEPLTDGLDDAGVVFADGHAEYLPANEHRRTIRATQELTIPP